MLPFSTVEEAELSLGRNLTAAEKLWLSYSSDKSDFVLFAHNVPFLFLVFLLSPLPYALLELCRWEKLDNHFKLQPKAIRRCLSDIFRCYKEVSKTLGFIVSPLLLLSFPAYKWLGVHASLQLPSIGEMFRRLLVYFLIEDYLNYWLHRLLHFDLLYHTIHIRHHEYETPSGYASLYTHWAEIIILGSPTSLGPAIVPCHIITFWLWIILRQVEAIDVHKGYEFPWSLTRYIPFYGGSQYHDFHHSAGQSRSNFASVFTYCDLIYGTNKGYRHYKRAKDRQMDDKHNNITINKWENRLGRVNIQLESFLLDLFGLNKN